MRVCVYCGSAEGHDPVFVQGARALGDVLAGERVDLVYGGGRVGLMGVLADAVLAGGGRVIGVIPRALLKREIAHRGLTELRVVESMHERKALMANLADGFLAMPGGAGTLEELFEAWAWGQLGLHAKPCGLLNIGGYYDALIAFLDRATTDGFVGPQHRTMLVVETDARRLLDHFRRYTPPQAKWAGERCAAPEVDVLTWICVRASRVLAVRSHGRDVFYLPGGKRRPGESDLEALMREIREELGVEILRDKMEFMTVVEAPAHGYPEGTLVRMTCYSAEYAGELACDSEIDEIDWLTYADRNRCAPAAQRVIEFLAGRGLIR
jgi:uncharacterized protein (TIGR00730 family)